MKSDDKEDSPLALRSSQRSTNAPDEKVAPLPPQGSASASYVTRSITSSDEKDELAPALDVSRRLSDAFEEQATRSQSQEPSPVGDEALATTSPNENEVDHKRALNSSQLADILDKLPGDLNQPGSSRAAAEDSLASLLTALSLVNDVRRHRSHTLADR